MNFEFDDTIVKLVNSVSSKFDLKYWRDICLARTFPIEYWKELSRSGLFGIMIGKIWGGMERGLLDLVLGVEETARRYAGIGSYLFLSGSLVSTIFSQNGSVEQKNEFLPKLAKGELKISIALGEESSGFDATSISTKASKVSDDEFEISGAKAFVNNVDLADYLVLFARTSNVEKDGKKSKGITMFVVDANAPGIRATKLEKLGWDFVNNFSIKIDGLKVRKTQALGKLDNAWYGVVPSFNMDRVATSASLVGTGRLALDLASSWANGRTIFDKSIGSYQGIQFPLAESFVYLENAWIQTLKAASIADQGKNYQNEANYSLLSASNAAMSATDRALQTFGGHGYFKEYDIERLWRDVRVHKIHPISEELILASIAERSLGLPRSYS